MNPKINKTVLMSGADYFRVEELNPYSHKDNQPNVERARAEHATVTQALESAGVSIIKVAAPAGCQDGIYTANWGLCRGDKVVLSSLPNLRASETPHAEKALRDLGKEIIKPPHRFSGQGDALPCGNLLFCGSGYRTDPRVHGFLAATLGYEIISLQTIPELDAAGQPIINQITGWPDSFFYDIDLAISILTPELIAWCPEAFTPESQDKIRNLAIGKIEVPLAEATQGFACNLVSTGQTVIMNSNAPQLQAAIESHGLKTIALNLPELRKGGGSIRCTTLTLDND